jgi:hypothetical protein
VVPNEGGSCSQQTAEDYNKVVSSNKIIYVHMGGTVPGLRARRGCKSDNASGNNKRSLGNNQQKMISQEMPPWIYQDLKEGLTSLFLRKTM